MSNHPVRTLSGLAALVTLAAAAFMYQVPFTADFEIVTKKLCSDSLQASLFMDPAGGTSWCWRDGQSIEHASFIVSDQKWHRLVYWQNDREYIKAFGGYGSS
ncbi:hypothetical protein FJY70_02485, partial [candidate division WOR-3 bacterium]|nr:hypothetical protein [candidate division WOR-3 bacterium]